MFEKTLNLRLQFNVTLDFFLHSTLIPAFTSKYSVLIHVETCKLCCSLAKTKKIGYYYIGFFSFDHALDQIEFIT